MALEPGIYDVAFARCLLSHVTDPSSVVRAMASALRPGGVVIVEDIDFRGCFSHPAGGPFERYVELYRETVRRRGGNADLGPALPSLLGRAGLAGVGAATYQASAMEGDPKLIAPLTLERITQAAVEEHVADADDLRRLADELYEFCADPTTFVAGPRMVQAWGWSPAR
jgi:SAM-dependent methyltransferase